MIVYNTTFHASESAAPEFLEWLRTEFVPAATACGRLAEPRLTLVLNAHDSDGRNYSLQFRSADVETLCLWYADTGNRLMSALESRFGHSVAGFSTLLEEVEL